MSANVETMFSVRETPWHGLGRIVMDAPASREALELAGLDWQVESRNIYSGTGAMIPGYRANVRSTDDAVLADHTNRGHGNFYTRAAIVTVEEHKIWGHFVSGDDVLLRQLCQHPYLLAAL